MQLGVQCLCKDMRLSGVHCMVNCQGSGGCLCTNVSGASVSQHLFCCGVIILDRHAASGSLRVSEEFLTEEFPL
jgi:hypothetical protein